MMILLMDFIVLLVFFSEKSKFSFNQMICALVCWNSNHFFFWMPIFKQIVLPFSQNVNLTAPHFIVYDVTPT